MNFDTQVLVMTSIRKPKRITIRGNDEKEYHYLVKGGEDLRQDQRIEQLFHLMNQVFEKNPACRHRKLYVRTYQVIPMTTRLVYTVLDQGSQMPTLFRPTRCLLIVE